MAGYIKYVKNEDGVTQRVAADTQEVISVKEAQLLAMYNELKALKGE